MWFLTQFWIATYLAYSNYSIHHFPSSLNRVYSNSYLLTTQSIKCMTVHYTHSCHRSAELRNLSNSNSVCWVRWLLFLIFSVSGNLCSLIFYKINLAVFYKFVERDQALSSMYDKQVFYLNLLNSVCSWMRSHAICISVLNVLLRIMSSRSIYFFFLINNLISCFPWLFSIPLYLYHTVFIPFASQ